MAHSQWIQSEIEAALDFKKPILGVAPRGQERIPETAKMAIENAHGELVRWNRESIIAAISRQAGLEPASLELPGSPRLQLPVSRPSFLEDFMQNQSAAPPGPASLADLFGNIAKNPKK